MKDSAFLLRYAFITAIACEIPSARWRVFRATFSFSMSSITLSFAVTRFACCCNVRWSSRRSLKDVFRWACFLSNSKTICSQLSTLPCAGNKGFCASTRRCAASVRCRYSSDAAVFSFTALEWRSSANFRAAMRAWLRSRSSWHFQSSRVCSSNWRSRSKRQASSSLVWRSCPSSSFNLVSHVSSSARATASRPRFCASRHPSSV